ncbi:Hypothetical predicted protein [Paramuricea clavata]|uniref:Uncharacterized protein n=1 Tax=Paramuricea clavata TaxID=317549 RepID=A0A7D9KCB2_PARCT|nr:Hypothetical predicted protein [Paramuricea clavata]
MATCSKRSRFSAEDVLGNSDRGGMSSGEQSDIDRQLMDLDESMSYEEEFPDLVPSVGDAGGDDTEMLNLPENDDANADDEDDDYIPGAEIGTSSPVCGSGTK